MNDSISVTLLVGIVLLSGCSGLGVPDSSSPSETPVPDDPPAPDTESTPDEPATPTTDGTATPSPTPIPTAVDSDGDGLNDSRETSLGLDSTRADSDGDGLQDGAELANGTNATVADSDGDGLEDGPELLEYGTNPLVVDTDRDGLSDSTELRLGTVPTRYDSDRDGLNDSYERTLGTNPTSRDTDGDGLTDGLEVKRTDVLPGADPLRKDVYVEVDYMSDGSLTRADYRYPAVVEAFADAPVRNPDGTRGITLHLRLDDSVPVRDRIEFDDRDDRLDDFRAYESRFRDYQSVGYHYALGVKDLRRSDPDAMRLGGKAGIGRFVFEPTPSVFAHELGHSLGLTEFRGIDSENLSYEAYPSVMNYNAPRNAVAYATGNESDVSHDDWSVVTDSMLRGLGATGVRVRCLDPSFAGGDGTAANPYEIETFAQFSCIRADLDAHYELTGDIDATGRTGFKPLGHMFGSDSHREPPFTGTFDGNGHAIRNLTIEQPGQRRIALFEEMAGTVRDLRVPDAEVVGQSGVAIIAVENRGTIRNVTVTGYVSGSDRGTESGGAIGGVAAFNGDRSQIRSGPDTDARIVDSAADVAVRGMDAGGLVGVNIGTVTRSAAFGDVNGAFAGNPNALGGLVGSNVGIVDQSFATGNVTGGWQVGGLVGWNARGRITDAYATGTVRGHYRTIGGLVGRNDATVRRVYATSRVEAVRDPPAVGGMFGEATGGTTAAAYWNAENAGTTLDVGEGTANVTTVRNPTGSEARRALSGLDFDSVWQTTATSPTLRWVNGTDLPGNATVRSRP